MLLPSIKRRLLPTGDGATIPYVCIGNGPVPIVVLPGAGDGLRTAYDAALQLGWFYRRRAKRHRLLVLSRRLPLPPDHSIKDQAQDALFAVEQLGWGPALWECNSAGGPVGQRVAVQRPDLVRGLVLSSTLHRTSETTRRVIENWLRLAEGGDWHAFARNSLECTYRPSSLTRFRLVQPLLARLDQPRWPERVIYLLRELLDMDQSALLPRIVAPTLVIGGRDDQVIPAEVMREMARQIPECRMRLYYGYGHGNDLENPAYSQDIDLLAQAVFGAT
ncbi:MAG: alpha/beta fold hydrolase [Anaerolineae bacterium]